MCLCLAVFRSRLRESTLVPHPNEKMFFGSCGAAWLNVLIFSLFGRRFLSLPCLSHPCPPGLQRMLHGDG